MSGEPRGEDRLLAWLRHRLRTSFRDPIDLLGDDTARLPATSSPLAVTVDSQIEGVHFPSGLDEAVLARRLVEVNLSDLAASGARPRWVFLALNTAAGFDHRRFFDALLAACADRGVTLAGGDLARTGDGDRASAPTVATLTLLGEAPSHSGARTPLHRANGRAGDDLWVAGTLGESAAGCRLVARGARLRGETVTLPPAFETPPALAEAAWRAVRRHLAPRAQLELGRALLGRSRVAAMDLSDGLARDLPRLCRESGVGAIVDVETLPRPEGFSALVAALAGTEESDPETHRTELTWLLGGGEDYVLLFSLPRGEEPPAEAPATRIGELVEAPESGNPVRLRRGQHVEPMPAAGWDHLAG